MHAYNVKRSQILLRDLERSTRGMMPMFRFEEAPAAAPTLTCLANRAGLLRLGVRLAALAFTANQRVVLERDGTIGRDGKDGIVEIILIEDLPGQSLRRSPWRVRVKLSRLWGEVLAGAVILVYGMLAAVGLVSAVWALLKQ